MNRLRSLAGIAAVFFTLPFLQLPALATTATQVFNGQTYPIVQTDTNYPGGHRPETVQGSGENHVGAVGGTISASSDTIFRPANTTAYSATQYVGTNLTVSGATNATPIVVTTGTHNLATGDVVTIASVGGNTAANGTFKVTVLSSTTFSLQNLDGTNVAGSGAYTSGGTAAQLLVFHLGRVANGTCYIQRAKLMLQSATVANGSFRLYIYGNSAPGGVADQTTFNLLWANRTYLQGWVDFTLITGGNSSDAAMAFQTGLITPVTTDAFGNVYGHLVTSGAYVPTSAEGVHVALVADQN